MSPVLKKLLLLAAALLTALLLGRYALPIVLPFALAALTALAAEPLVFFFHTRLKLPRPAAAGIGMTITLLILTLLLTVVAALMVRQLRTLVALMPDMEGSARDGLQSLEQWLLGISNKAPESIRPMVRQGVEQLFDGGSTVVEELTARLVSLASGMVSHLPSGALGIATWLLASYMFSVRIHHIRQQLARRMPQQWKDRYLPMLRRLKSAVLAWLSAQLKLISISFAVLTVGFWLLRVRYAPLWALLIALVDALPVLGTGTVLVPWSLVCLLQGNMARALGLLGIFAAVTLLRTMLEPKLVGAKLGLDPLVTLAAMYTGYRLWGILGMLLSPLLAVTVIQLLTAPEES